MSKFREIGIILLIFIAFSPTITPNLDFKNSEFCDGISLDNENLKISAVSGKIHIINNSGWVDFRNAGNCTGSGTYSDPYIVQGLEIDGGGSGNCIKIENSDVYFRIQNCKVYNSGDVGIILESVSNGVLISNEVLYNGGGGIGLSGCSANEISTNIIVNNSVTELFLGASNYNIISRNTVINNNNNEYGIQLKNNSHNNTITGNTCETSFYGISIDDSDDNVVSENIVNDNNNAGIAVLMADNNIISGNIISNSIRWGITVYNGDYNTFTENIISNSGSTGLLLGGAISLSSFNNVYLNCFNNNSFNAGDTGPNNQWDNGVKGNYWDDYTGLDADGNGIGDVPYNISGSAGSQDNFPLMTCPISASQGFPIELIILVSVISGGAVIGVATFLLIRRKRKRIE